MTTSLFIDGLLELPASVAGRVEVDADVRVEVTPPVTRIAEGLLGEFAAWVEAGHELSPDSRERLWKLGEYETGAVAWSLVDEVVRTCHELVVDLAIANGRSDVPQLARGMVEVAEAMYGTHSVHEGRGAVEQVTRMGLLADRLPTPVFIADAVGTITFVNHAFVGLVGISHGALLGMSLTTVLGDDVALGGDQQSVIVVARDGGDRRHFQLLSFSLVGPQGVEYFGQLFERTDEVRLDRANDRLVSVISHELRTPLTSVMGYAELLGMEGALSSAERLEALDAIQHDARHLLAIVDDLVLYTGLETDRYEIDPVHLNLRTAVDRALRRLGPSAAGVTVDVDESLVVFADETRFEQLVANLVTNAGRYGAPPIIVAASAARAGVEISVTDHGAGIPADELPQIFESFYQGTARAKGTGSGLGLAICRAIMRSHGGSIDVDERAPTTFRAFFPGSD